MKEKQAELCKKLLYILTKIKSSMESSIGQIVWNNYQIQEAKGRYEESTNWKLAMTLNISTMSFAKILIWSSQLSLMILRQSIKFK